MSTIRAIPSRSEGRAKRNIVCSVIWTLSSCANVTTTLPTYATNVSSGSPRQAGAHRASGGAGRVFLCGWLARGRFWGGCVKCVQSGDCTHFAHMGNRTGWTDYLVLCPMHEGHHGLGSTVDYHMKRGYASTPASQRRISSNSLSCPPAQPNPLRLCIYPKHYPSSRGAQ